jgi:MATE family multidrug resistance protein
VRARLAPPPRALIRAFAEHTRRGYTAGLMTSSTAVEAPAPFGLGQLLGLAWPVILARATQSVIGFSDALMVAPLGEEPLAAVTTGALNTFALIILPMGTVFIVQSFTAQLRGRGELGAVKRYALYGLLIALLAGLLALAFIPLIPALLRPFGFAPRVHELMCDYLMIRLLSVGPAVGIEALGNWYGGLGNTRAAMIAGVVAMTVNVIGCYALIEPRFGLPGYGVAGSAWASVIGTWLGFAVIAIGFARGIGYERISASLAFQRSEFVRTLRFGLPNGVNWFLEFAAFAVFINLVVAHLGTRVLAAFNVVIQINSISFMPAFGLASAGAIMVGEAIGQQRNERVWPIVKLTAQTTATFMGSVGLVYLCFSSGLMSLFSDRGQNADQLAQVGATMLALSSVWQIFDALGLTFGEALRAAGDTAWCMYARVVLAWAVFTPLAWLTVRVYDGGVHALMGALIVYTALLALALTGRFATGRWREIDLVGIEPAPL